MLLDALLAHARLPADQHRGLDPTRPSGRARAVALVLALVAAVLGVRALTDGPAPVRGVAGDPPAAAALMPPLPLPDRHPR